MTNLSFRGGFRTSVAILLVAVVCTSPGAAVAFTDSSHGTAADVSDSEFVRASDSVSVWRNAPFPLRVNADASDGTVIENQQVTVLAEEQGAEIRLNKQQVAVFNPDEEIQMSFQSRYPITTQAFGDAEVQLLAAKVGPNASTSLLGSDPSTTGIMELLTNAGNTDGISYELQDVGNLQDGSLTTSYDVSESGPARGPGQYVFYLVQTTEGDGFTGDDGSLSVDGNVRVLGADIAVVQAAEASATVTSEEPARGNTVTFDVDSTFTHSNVTHTLVLYNEQQYTDGWTRISVSGPLNDDLSAEQVNVTSSFVGIDGPHDVRENVSTGDESITSKSSVRGVVNWLVDQSRDAPESAGQTEGQWLDGSVTAFNSADGATTIDVQTDDDWTDGTYRYVYLAQAKGGDNLSTATGTVELEGDTTAPSVTNVEVTPGLAGGQLPTGTTTANISLTYDDPSGIDIGGVSTTFDGRDVTAETTIDESGLEYTAEGLQNGETYTFTATLTDNDGNEVTETVTFQVGPRSSRSGGGGGGNGGGNDDNRRAEPPGQSNTPRSLMIIRGEADLSVDRAISRLRVNFERGGTGGSVNVQSLDGRPAAVPAIPDSTGYAYVDVTVPQGREDGNATLRLTVDAAAVGDTEPTDLVVYHYHDGQWTALDTSVVSADDEAVTLEATTPGFSVFAIGSANASAEQTATPDETGDDSTSPEPGTEPPATESTPTEQVNPAVESPTEEPIQEQGGFDTDVLVLLVGLLALLAVYVGYRRL